MPNPLFPLGDTELLTCSRCVLDAAGEGESAGASAVVRVLGVVPSLPLLVPHMYKISVFDDRSGNQESLPLQLT